MLTCLLGDKPAERVVAHLPRLLPPSQNKHTWRTGRENESGCEIMKMPLQISTLILSPARSCRLAIGSCEAVVARGPLPLRAPAFGGVARAWKSRPSPCSNRTSRRCCPSRTRRRHYLPFLDADEFGLRQSRSHSSPPWCSSTCTPAPPPQR
jgi:hypothetical protein